MKYSIGKIVRTHGIKGEVKVISSSDFNRIAVKETVYIDQKPYVISSVRRQNEYYLVGFEGLNTLNDVEPLKGKEVYTNKEPEVLSEDEFHLPKLIDLACVSDQGVYLGKVESVILLPQGYYLRIQTKESKKILIPFIKEFILDVKDDEILIKVIEGLL